MAKRTRRTDHTREKLLDVLRETCNVSAAAKAACIGRTTAYAWRADAAFPLAWDDAEQKAANRLEGEAWRRAIDGTDKPIVHQGKVTATTRNTRTEFWICC